MSTLLLAPHGDDETLFAAYTCMRERLHVVVCSQDADPEVRKARSLETTAAITILGCSHHEWPVPAGKLDWGQARLWLQGWGMPDKVYAPFVNPVGHEDHNRIGNLARDVFGDNVIYYKTYAPRGTRERGPTEVKPTAEELRCKLKALACYRTQIENPSTRSWFFELLDMREWLA